MGMLEGKTGIVFGVANKRSIAWAIAQALAREGMRLAFTFQGERLKESVEELSSTLPGSLLLPCDVSSDAEVESVFAMWARNSDGSTACSTRSPSRRARTWRTSS